MSSYILDIFCIDGPEAIPLIRPQGRPNPKLWAAVRKLMVGGQIITAITIVQSYIERAFDFLLYLHLLGFTLPLFIRT